ncbi:MAG: hypothetical protein QOF60_1392 [Actinomycetota bacterium]|jgi:hypothetical protein|nr:hypothetical protein [Actinomycetota bacterium]
MSRWWMALLLVPVFVLPACGNDGGPAAGRATTTTTTTGAEGFGTATVSDDSGERGLLVKVRATDAGDVERVTFEFEGALPGYRVGYVERPIVEDGSGKEVTVDGGSVLGVRFEPASGFDLSGGGRQVFKGPDRLDLATTTITDVVRTGDFEAVLTWAVGIDGAKAPFRVVADAAARTISVEVASS